LLLWDPEKRNLKLFHLSLDIIGFTYLILIQNQTNRPSWQLFAQPIHNEALKLRLTLSWRVPDLMRLRYLVGKLLMAAHHFSAHSEGEQKFCVIGAG
jgi:hypothetical protein